jgi:hypothetical protein
MSFDRRTLDDKGKTVSDTEVNEALENDELDESGLDAGNVEHEDKAEHENGDRPPAPDRRPPTDQDVTPGTEGRPVEPPD